jgi:hypothetical protein
MNNIGGARGALGTQRQGLFTVADARAGGVGPMALSRGVAAGRFVRVFPGVYRLATAAPTYRQRLLAACLWAGPGAVVSHRAAARLYGLDGVDTEEVELIAPSKLRRPAGIVGLHRAKLDGRDQKVLDGIPVTSVARTLVDLARTTPAEKLAELLDCAWRRKLARLNYVSDRLEAVATRGLHGARALREALRDCEARGKPLGSVLEVQTWYLIKRAGLPLPECGLVFEPLDGQPGAIDFAYPEHSVAIECDGYAYHALTRDQFEGTERRASQLAALGWRVLRVTSRMLGREPRAVVKRIAVALATPKVPWHSAPREAED